MEGDRSFIYSDKWLNGSVSKRSSPAFVSRSCRALFLKLIDGLLYVVSGENHLDSTGEWTSS